MGLQLCLASLILPLWQGRTKSPQRGFMFCGWGKDSEKKWLWRGNFSNLGVHFIIRLDTLICFQTLRQKHSHYLNF